MAWAAGSRAQANPPCLHSHVHFINRFRNPARLEGEQVPLRTPIPLQFTPEPRPSHPRHKHVPNLATPALSLKAAAEARLQDEPPTERNHSLEIDHWSII
jgi:hypothetical protein